MLPTCERVLRHQDTDDRDVSGASALAPARRVHARVIYEGPEDKLGRLVCRRGCEDCDDQASRSDGVPPYRDVVDVLEQMHAEGVDETLADKHTRVDTDSDTRLGNEVGVECGQR